MKKKNHRIQIASNCHLCIILKHLFCFVCKRSMRCMSVYAGISCNCLTFWFVSAWKQRNGNKNIICPCIGFACIKRRWYAAIETWDGKWNHKMQNIKMKICNVLMIYDNHTVQITHIVSVNACTFTIFLVLVFVSFHFKNSDEHTLVWMWMQMRMLFHLVLCWWCDTVQKSAMINSMWMENNFNWNVHAKQKPTNDDSLLFIHQFCQTVVTIHRLVDSGKFTKAFFPFLAL